MVARSRNVGNRPALGVYSALVPLLAIPAGTVPRLILLAGLCWGLPATVAFAQPAFSPMYWDEDRLDSLNTASVSGGFPTDHARFSNGQAHAYSGSFLINPKNGQGVAAGWHHVKLYTVAVEEANYSPEFSLRVEVYNGYTFEQYAFSSTGVLLVPFEQPFGEGFPSIQLTSYTNEGFYLDRVDIIAGVPPVDFDGDGCPDEDDPDPVDPDVSCNCEINIGGGVLQDDDCDGCPNSHEGHNCDCPGDWDCDGIPDDEDNDDDNDGCDDVCDPDPEVYNANCECDCPGDADCDGVPDEDDPCPDDPDNDCCDDPNDADCDGTPDDQDPCPDDPQNDCCGDSNDSDCDGTEDPDDPCPNDPQDKCDDCPGDVDCDGCPDAHDRDNNRPGCGDLCLGDSDCDGCPDATDQYPFDPQQGCDDPPETCPGDVDCDQCPDSMDSHPFDPTRGCGNDPEDPPGEGDDQGDPPGQDPWPEMPTFSTSAFWNFSGGQIGERNLRVDFKLPRDVLKLSGPQTYETYVLETLPPGQEGWVGAYHVLRMTCRGFLSILLTLGAMWCVGRVLIGG